VDAGTREQSNTVVAIGQSALLKAYRQLQAGVNCEIEIGRHLSANATSNVPGLLGAMHYQKGDEPPAVVASVQAFVANQGDAWTLTLQALDRFLNWVEAHRPELPEASPPDSMMARARCAPPDVLQQQCATDLGHFRLLGRRTAEMHLALGTPSADPAFEREPFSAEYQTMVHQAARARLTRLIEAARATRSFGSERTQALLAELTHQESLIDAILNQVHGPDFAVERIRCHGDLHLGQVLFTGDDFVIIDFEGEPARSLSERRLKQCVLRDVTGMIRSFSYAGDMACRERRRGPDTAQVEPWAQAFSTWMAAAYLGAYLERLGSSPLVPGQDMLSDALLDFYELDKALYEVEYELGSRPDWIDIPLLGVGRIVRRWRNRSGEPAVDA
jgi:maltose alpha-D-glucosyltransferase/alpha-amylase